MMEKGVALGKIDLQALLYDVLQKGIDKDRRYSDTWRDWLLAQGADINEPSLRLEISALAIRYNNSEYLAWLLTNSKNTTEELNKLLHLAVTIGAEASKRELLERGANINSVEPDQQLQTTMLIELLGYPRTKKFAERDYSSINPEVLNVVLQAAAEISKVNRITNHSKHDYLPAIDELLTLGAKIEAIDLQKLLEYALNDINQNLVDLTMEHGADVNLLDLNYLIKVNIYKHAASITVPYGKPLWKSSDGKDFFALLTRLGFENKEILDLPLLLSVAEEEDRRLVEWARRKGIENAPTTGFVEQLRLLQQE